MTFGFNITAQNSNPIVCKLNFYVAYVVSLYLPIVLILASIDRLLISSQNVDTRLYSSKRLAYLTVSTSLFVYSTFSVHILIKVDLQEISPGIFLCFFDKSKSYQDFVSYSSTILTFVSSTILLIISLFSFHNVRHIRSIPREQRNRIRSMTKKDFQLLRCLYVYDIVYNLSIIVSIIGILHALIYPIQEQTEIQQALQNFLTTFGSFIHFVPYCSSFLIFLSVSRAFRQEFKRFSYRLCCQNVNIVQEENQAQGSVERENNKIKNAPIETIQLAY